MIKNVPLMKDSLIYSLLYKNKLNKIYNKYCQDDVDRKLVFQSFKIESFFNTKDKLPT